MQQLDGQPTQPIVQQLAVQQGTHAAAEQLSDPSVQPTAQPDTIQQQVQAASFVGLQTREPSVQALPATEHLIRGGPQVPAETVQGFRFTTECKGQSVKLSSDGLLAKHMAPQEEVLQGVVFCNSPVPVVNGGWYFAVQVETTQNTELDGLVLGITTTPPAALAQIAPEGFEAADDVPNSWSFGYNGQMRVDEVDDPIPISWNPKDLQKGDVVGLFISADGEGRIYQNDIVKLSKVSGLPVYQAMYPFIDLLGNTVAVCLSPNAQPASMDGVAEAVEEEQRSPAVPLTYDFSTAQLTSFAMQPRPRDVMLSAEMLLVKRKSNIFSQDMVYGNGVAPNSPLGSYFEVRLESTVARGFALGFQAASAVGSKVTEAPATACSLGFDGMALIGGSSSLVPDWPTRPWCASDRVGLLASAGYLALALNGEWLVEVPGAIPEGPLVPFIDLGGGPMAVSLEVGAEAPRGGALGGFHRRLCSPLVTLEGKTKALRTGVHPKGAGLGCVLFGDGPVPTFPEGRYFEVCIEEVTQVFADGLNLGVAVGLPSALPAEPYATCEEVPKSFCYGFDGMAHRHDMEDMIPIDWSPENLEIGDAVGILVTPQRVMQLIVNGVLEAHVIDGVPEEELFPLVELMGNTVAVSLRPGAAPPAIRHKVKEAAEEPPPLPAPEQLPASTAPPPPTETLPLAAQQRPSAESTQRPSAAASSAPPRRSTQPRPAPKATEPAFCAQLLSKNMQLSKDGNSVRHKDESGRELHGIAVGMSPLIPFPAGRYFEVRVDRVREGMPDGLALGFTLVPPNELAGEDPHEVSDTLPESWTAGYDGFYRSVNMGESEQVRVGWKPSSLEVNDRVGALLSRAGQFIVVVNGKVVVRVTDDFPLADVEAFYPVVDLLGRVCQVTMVRDAVPPAASVDGTIFTGFDPKLLGKAVSLSNSRLSCSSRDPVGKELGGVVFGDGPLPCTGPDGEAYFEVVVEELRQGNDDGLVLGVASKRPQAMDDILMGCDVKEAWSIGYNGCSFSPDVEEDIPVKWSPVNLKRGDHMGLLIQGDGSLIVLLNASPVCKGPKKAPVLDVPLYPFVDLLGNTKAVQLVKPTAELVKTAVVNCAKAVKRSLVSGKDPAFFDAW